MGPIFIKRFLPSAMSRFFKVKSLSRGGKRVIDVGCSIGLLTNEIAKKSGVAIGVDIDKTYVKEAKRLFPNCAFVIGDSKNLPFKAGCFDAAVSSEVIEHIDRPADYAKEVFRVLSGNGQFVLTTPNRDIGRPFIGRLPAISLIWVFAKLTGNKKFVYPYGHYHGGFSPTSLRETLGNAGFHIKKTKYCGFWLTKIFDDILYILAVYAGKTKESSWTKGPSIAAKLASMALLAFLPLIFAITVIDEIFLALGAEGYLIAMEADKQDLSKL